MANGIKLIPLSGINTDVSNQYMKPDLARFIKNLYYTLTDNAESASTQGSQLGVLKPLQANAVYCPIILPKGDNTCIGTLSVRSTKELYVWVHNSNDDHCIFRINGDKKSCTIVKIDPCFDFKLSAEYFIHESASYLQIVVLIDPVTGETLKKKDLYWTNGKGYMGYLRVDDCIDTNGFDETIYPYFIGDYDKCETLRMGLPTPKSCIKIEDIPTKDQFDLIDTTVGFAMGIAPNTLILGGLIGGLPFSEYPQFSDQIIIAAGNPLSGTYTVVSFTGNSGSQLNIIVEETVPQVGGLTATFSLYRLKSNDGVNNRLLYNTWQFRIKDTDVWGRVSEYGVIANTYVPGINDCISSGSNLPSCVNLIFDAGNPFINTKEIAWRNCNDETWHTETVLFLWTGSNIGQWWLRVRNPELNYDPVTNKITYKFCRDKQCEPIDVNETNRLQNPLPKTCQSIFPLNKTIATANNKDGFNPFSQDLRSKIKMIVTPPNSANSDARDITIYAVIGNFDQQVSKRENKFVYGGMNGNNGGVAVDLVNQKKQFFANKDQSGFCGYLVNGSLSISTQVYIDALGNLIDDPKFDGWNLSPSHRTLQKFEFFNVPKGHYIFRIASQTTDPTVDSGYRDTSCPMWGLCPFDKTNNYYLDFNNRTANPATELYIDVCTGNYNSLTDNKILVIANMAIPFTYAQCGYFKETVTDATKWELLKVFNGGIVGNTVSSIRTDANGFYWVYRFGGTSENKPILLVAAYSKCKRIDRALQTTMPSLDILFQDYYMKDFFIANGTFESSICNYVSIKGRLLLQGTFIAVSNVLVSLTRGGSAITDDNGYFVIKAHDDASNENPYGVRNDKIIFSGGACTYVDVTGCVPMVDIQIISCAITDPNHCVERILNITPTIELVYKQQRGLLSGGTYLPFVNGYDWLGRKTYSQSLGLITIPSIIQTKAIAPSTVEFQIDPSATFPDEIKYLTFSFSEETTIEKYLSWIVDRLEFLDSSGKIITDTSITTPTQIRIYYQSVTEFNSINNYNTTTAWQIIPEGKNTPVISDKIQFFLNGDGQYFTKNITSLVKYESSGISFTIDYTSDLLQLKPNALLRFIRPKTCTGTEPNFEVCYVVDVVKGKALINRDVLDVFDTYYLPRQIPVPAPLSSEPTVDQIATTTGNVVVFTTPAPPPTVIELRNLGFPFEHNSPSNFWGEGCKNLGRINVVNPYEAELIHENQIAYGGALSINGQLNYQQYFSDNQKHDFSVPNTGGIVYVNSKQGILLIITQFNNWTVGFGDNLPRIDANGNLVAPSGADTFGNPNIQISGNYGCQIFDKNAIRERDGLVHFLDTSRVAILQHNFQNCQDISSNKTNPNRKSTILSWLAKKIISIRDHNNVSDNEKRFFHSVINPANNEYIISDFTIKSTEYINDERDYAYDLHESMAYDIKADCWKGQYAFTPEYYGYLESELIGNQLFAFKNGTPYFFYSITNTVYNTFFGVKCGRVYTFVINEENMKKFKPLWMEVYCKQSGYFADKITTETGQLSRILIGYWKQGEFMFSASFMRDLNTLPDPNNPQSNANPLIDGNVLYGTWVEVRMIGYPDKDDVYSQLEGIQSFIIGESNTGIR